MSDPDCITLGQKNSSIHRTKSSRLRTGMRRNAASNRSSAWFSAKDVASIAGVSCTAVIEPLPVASHSNVTPDTSASAIRWSMVGDVPAGSSHCATALGLTAIFLAKAACVRPANRRACRMRVDKRLVSGRSIARYFRGVTTDPLGVLWTLIYPADYLVMLIKELLRERYLVQEALIHSYTKQTQTLTLSLAYVPAR